MSKTQINKYSLDYPEQWPSFFDDILMTLKSNDFNMIQGSIRVIQDFVRDDLSDQSFPLLAPFLIPELYVIFSNPNVSFLYILFTIIL